MQVQHWCQEYRDKISARVRPHPTKSCLLWKGGLNSKKCRVRYGMVNVSWFPNRPLPKRTKLHAHKIAYMAYTGNLDIDPELHVSHRCHVSTCVLVQHLSLEPADVNNSRKQCVSLGYCLDHTPHPPCIFN